MDASILNLNPTAERAEGPARPRLIGAIKHVAGAVASILVSAFITWGSFQYVKGRDANRLDNVEKTLDKTLSREEFKTWTEEQRDRLTEINNRLRDRENARR